MNHPICFVQEEMLVHGDLEAERAEKKSVKTATLHYDPGPDPDPLLLLHT